MITVIDSIMGCGKTSWAIKYMNNHPDDHFLYITPYCSELERIIEACPRLRFQQPNEERINKSAHFHQLLKDGCNIALTHKLFSILRLSKVEFELIEALGYTLILDEVLEVVNKINIKPHDIEMLLETGKFSYDKESRQVLWIDKEYKGEFESLKRQVQNSKVVYSNQKQLLWIFPEEMLKILANAYILTYMFDGSYLKPFFEIHNLPYQMAYVKNGILMSGKNNNIDEIVRISSLIHIDQSEKRNSIGEKKTALSKSWYQKNTHEVCMTLFKNAYNYLHNICHATQKTAMYTVYDEVIHKNGKKCVMYRYGENSYVPCNCRATNTHAERKHLAYLINLYSDPVIDECFLAHGKRVDTDAFVLSMLLQWIWRSAIRNGEEIHLYIPSKRMRDLLESWMTPNKLQTELCV